MCGDLHRLLHKLYETHSLDLLRSLDGDLPEALRQEIMLEFERARSHLLSHLTLKLSHWSQPPLILFGLAHPDQRQAHAVFDKCLGLDASCDDSHYQLQRFLSRELEDERTQFKDQNGRRLQMHVL